MLKFAKICVLLLLALASASPAFALPSMQPTGRGDFLKLGLGANNYLTKGSETISDERTGYTSFNVSGRAHSKDGDLRFGVEGDGAVGLARYHYRYLNFSEAYAGYHPNAWSLYLGRKKYNWSSLDSYWSQGIFQPRFRWDYLNEKENGLFGLFSAYERPGFSLVLFASPIFIPEQGAPFEISGGDCRSSSPWFSCPSSTMSLFNQETDVQFSVDVPPVRKLIGHAGGGATVQIGQESGPFGRASYAYKPINQLLLSYEGVLSVSTFAVPAVIRPRVLYHELFALDLGVNQNRYSAVVSGVWEKPEQDVTPSQWNTQEIGDAFLSSATLKTQPLANYKHTRVEISYLHRKGGNAYDEGPFVTANSSTFEPRYPFKNAYSFALISPIKDSWARSFLFSTKFVLDTLNQGNILVTDFYYSPARRTYLNLGADLLGSQSHRAEDFISRYQRNDRIRAAVTYAF